MRLQPAIGGMTLVAIGGGGAVPLARLDKLRLFGGHQRNETHRRNTAALQLAILIDRGEIDPVIAQAVLPADLQLAAFITSDGKIACVLTQQCNYEIMKLSHAERQGEFSPAALPQFETQLFRFAHTRKQIFVLEFQGGDHRSLHWALGRGPCLERFFEKRIQLDVVNRGFKLRLKILHVQGLLIHIQHVRPVKLLLGVLAALGQ